MAKMFNNTSVFKRVKFTNRDGDTSASGSSASSASAGASGGGNQNMASLTSGGRVVEQRRSIPAAGAKMG